MTIEKCIGRALSLRHKLLPKKSESCDSISDQSSDSKTNEPKSSDSEERRMSSASDTDALVSLISDLLCCGEVTVDGAAEGAAGQAILRLFDRALQVGISLYLFTLIYSLGYRFLMHFVDIGKLSFIS